MVDGPEEDDARGERSRYPPDEIPGALGEAASLEQLRAAAAASQSPRSAAVEAKEVAMEEGDVKVVGTLRGSRGSGGVDRFRNGRGGNFRQA